MDRTKKFLEAIFQEDKGFLCAWFHNLAYDKMKDRSYEIGPGLSGLDQLIESATKASAKGWDCYFAPAVFSKPRRLKENVLHSNVLWADFDSGNGLPEFETPPSLLVSSSSGKYHTYWAIDSPVLLADLESHNRGLTYAFKADKSGWDANQLLRIPGTLNYKYDPPQSVTLLTNGEASVSYPLSSFVSFLTGSLLNRYQHNPRFPRLTASSLGSLRVWI